MVKKELQRGLCLIKYLYGDLLSMELIQILALIKKEMTEIERTVMICVNRHKNGMNLLNQERKIFLLIVLLIVYIRFILVLKIYLKSSQLKLMEDYLKEKNGI